MTPHSPAAPRSETNFPVAARGQRNPTGTSSTSSVSPVARPPATAPQSPFETLRTLLRGFVQGTPVPAEEIADEAWSDVLGLASYHSVVAALATDLASPSDGPAVSAYDNFLREYPRRVRAKNKFLAQELERIQQGLATQRVRSLGFKGPALAAFAYGSLRRRTCADIDLLIAPDAFPVAREWLAAEGYRYSSQVKGRVGEQARQFFDRQHTFTRGRSVFHIDLHTGIMPPLSRYAPAFDALWNRRQTIQMEGYEAEVLAPGDMLLSLCHQGLKDRWAWLKHVLDVAMLIPHIGGHWPAMLDRAAACDSRRVLLLGLYLAHEVLKAPLPKAVIAEVQADGRVQRVGRWAVDKLPRRREEPRDGLPERMQLHGLIQDSVRGSAQYAFYAALRKIWYYTEQVWPTPSS